MLFQSYFLLAYARPLADMCATQKLQNEIENLRKNGI